MTERTLAVYRDATQPSRRRHRGDEERGCGDDAPNRGRNVVVEVERRRPVGREHGGERRRARRPAVKTARPGVRDVTKARTIATQPSPTRASHEDGSASSFARSRPAVRQTGRPGRGRCRPRPRSRCRDRAGGPRAPTAAASAGPRRPRAPPPARRLAIASAANRSATKTATLGLGAGRRRAEDTREPQELALAGLDPPPAGGAGEREEDRQRHVRHGRGGLHLQRRRQRHRDHDRPEEERTHAVTEERDERGREGEEDEPELQGHQLRRPTGRSASRRARAPARTSG